MRISPSAAPCLPLPNIALSQTGGAENHLNAVSQVASNFEVIEARDEVASSMQYAAVEHARRRLRTAAGRFHVKRPWEVSLTTTSHICVVLNTASEKLGVSPISEVDLFLRQVGRSLALGQVYQFCRNFSEDCSRPDFP